jgi:inosine-uridine nucleoside N-ribohydrolase
MKILLDTDIGTDIDDAVALAYLLGQPSAELLGITTVSGSAPQRAMIASAQCRAVSRSIPIYPGLERPLIIDPIQQTAPQAAALSRWPHDRLFPQGQAIEFLRRTIRQHPGEITLLAIGQLTNIAVLFTLDPEIPHLLKQLVMMNGAFLKPDRIPEYNNMLDPHAAAIVWRAPVPRVRSVGLDVTLQVTMPAGDVRARFHGALLEPVLDFAEVWFQSRAEITFHDPLAAATLFDERVCVFQRGRVSVDLNPGPELGQTSWRADDAGNHAIATEVDAPHFLEHFFRIVQNGAHA